jgi:purine-cytosine permease-like protein
VNVHLRNPSSHSTVVLAGITCVVVGLALVLNVLSLFLGENFMRAPTGDQPIDILFAIMGMAAAASCIWFWLRMFADYFRYRRQRGAAAWGWALVFLNVCAALAYFWFVWRPRHQVAAARTPNTSLERARDR